MKKFLLLMLFMVTSIAAWSNDGEQFTWNTVEGVPVTYTIISEEQKTCKVGYTYVKKEGTRRAIDVSTSGPVTIPSTANGYSVKEVSAYAFYECENLSSVVIPNGVTYIGKSAFCRCKGLMSIVLLLRGTQLKISSTS